MIDASAGTDASAGRRGRFITFEGPDGSGKSTQLRLLAERLRQEGVDVLETAEPGGTAVGQQIRRVLLDGKNQEISPVTELLLMFAARAQNTDQWIVPALRKGAVVLSDRWTDSTLAYQGAGRGLGSEVVLEVDRIACRGLVPDMTIYVDIDVDAGLARAKARAAYLKIVADEPERVKCVDGNRMPELVAADVYAAVRPLLSL
ncbi:MAG: dTMP kinase [Bryobacteraceae bacterium]